MLVNQGDGTFAAPVHYAAGQGSLSLAAADLNGDGRLDLAVVSADFSNGSDVSVLVNQGNGTFAAPVNYTTGYLPTSVAAADLNGDGEPDLAVANAHSNNVSALMNQGNGTFATPVDYVAGWGPQSVAAEDLNGDGRPDLAVAHGSVSVLLN